MSPSDPPDVDRLRAALARLGDEKEWPEPDTEEIFSALHGDMSAEERRDVVDELIRNPRAAAAWRLARELEPSGAGAPPAWRQWSWLPVAATLVLLAAAAWQYGPWRTPPPAYRSAEPRKIAPVLPADGRLSRTDPVLRWTAIEGARYRVRVLTPSLDPLAEAVLDSPEYRLPPDVVRGVPPGGSILWQVEALVRGSSGVTSPTFSTQLR